MKWVRRIILGVILLVIIAVVALYFSLDSIIKNTVQSQATTSLNLNTTLNSAALSLFGGKLSLNQLNVASPQGYAAPQMLSVGDTSVAVSYGQLRDDPIHVGTISIDKPMLVIEEKDGVLNFKKAMDGMPQGNSAPSTPSNKPPMKLIIDELSVTNPQVVVKGMPGGDITVPIPSLTLKNIGNADSAQNGAAVKDVVMQVITAMAGAASNSSALSAEFKAILGSNLNAVMGQLGADAQKRIAAALPGDLGKSIGSMVGNPQDLIKNPGNAVKGLLNNGGSTTQPSNSNVEDQAKNALQGLLGGNKNK